MSYANFVQAQLTDPLLIGGVEITLAAAEAPNQLPPVDGGVLVLADSVGKPSYVEIVRYTERDGLVLKGVTRGVESTVSRSWPEGTYCFQSLTAGEFLTAIHNATTPRAKLHATALSF